MTGPVRAAASDGVPISGPAGQRGVIKISGVASRGAYSFIEYSQPAGAPELPAHLHRDHEEAFYVIEGELMLAVGEFGESLVAVRDGQASVIPRGVIHRPVNVSGRPVRFLLISSPPLDGFFTGLAQLAERSGSQAGAGDLQELGARYDTIFTSLPAGAVRMGDEQR